MFVWKPSWGGLTWDSLRPGDVLVGRKNHVGDWAQCVTLILRREGKDHVAVELMTGKVKGVRGDGLHIDIGMWEVIRAS